MIDQIVIAVGIVIRKNRVLLVQRSHKEGSLNWQFPAGKLEMNEEPSNTAEREVFEETGVRCKAITHLGFRKHEANNVLIHYMICDYVGGQGFLKDSRENKDIRWVKINELRSYIPENLYHGIVSYFKL